MIIIPAGATLAGFASIASKVTVTMFGMEKNISTKVETYKDVYQAQLGNTPATIYTATADGPTHIKTIMVTNHDTVARTFQLFKGGTTDANALTPNFTLLPEGAAIYEDGLGWQFFTSTGQLLIANGMPTSGVVDNWGMTGNLGETMDRNLCPEVNTTIGTTGQIFCQAIWLNAGALVTNISFFSATTAAGTPTHYVFALYDINRNLLASSADQNSTAWAANTLKTLPMSTPYLVPTSGIYYLMISVVATTVPTLKGGTAKTGGQLGGSAPILQGVSSTTYATGTAPASIGTLTAGTANIWGCVT